jgi:hypothetical protein
MIPAEEHRSADGTLHFAVDSLSGGDVAIGFRDYAWHTHADMLASIRGLPELEAARSYVDDILNDRAVIAMQYIDGDLRDIWFSDAPNREPRYSDAKECIEFRYWSGATYSL